MSAKNAPERIYRYAYGMHMDGTTDVAWSITPAGRDSVEYVRADLIPRWVSVEEELPEKGDIRTFFVQMIDDENGGTDFAVACFVHSVFLKPFSNKTVTHYLSNVPPIPNTEGKT